MSGKSVKPPSPPPPPPTASAGPIVKEFKAPKFKDDGTPVLFFHPFNFYCQKVLLVLYEKNIEFIPYAMDLHNGEQYSAWFLNMNPKGDVPVLQDGAFTIPDSINIVNYLDKKCRDKCPMLYPLHIGSKESEKIRFYERLLGQVPVGALSMGSLIHEDLKLTPKPPFVGPIRKFCLKNNEKAYDLLKKSLEQVETNKVALIRKLDMQDRRRRLVYSRVEFQKILDAAQNVLNFVENDMKENPGREWLITSEFTIADVNFGLLLQRLYQLGFENYYWSYGKMPYIESYFLRFKKRDSYQKMVPTSLDILKDMWNKTPANYILGAGAGVIGMAMFAALAHK